jgi:outer membrane protein assembly factor BamB
MRRNILFVWSMSLLLLVSGLAFPCQAADSNTWTRFRGPNGSGVSDDESIPAQWSEENIRWKTTLPGQGHSSPVVWDDKIFLLSADPDTAMRYVLGISAANGNILWKRDYAAAKHALHPKSSYASVTPAVDEERVYAAWADPQHNWLCAFDHDGNELWKTDLGGWVGQHGFGTSPVLLGDLVILTSSQEPEKRAGGDEPTDCFIVGVDRATGEVRWRTPRKIDTASYSVPCIRKNAQGKEELVFLSTAEGIFALDPKTGQETWSSDKAMGHPAFTMRTVSSPLLYKDIIYGATGSGGGGNYIVAYRPGQTEPVFEIKKEMPYVPTPVIYEDLMFLWSDKGIVTCIQAETGKTVWQKRVGGNYSSSPIRCGKKIFCVDEEGTVVVIAAGNKFQELGRHAFGEKSHSTPAVADGKMYVRTVSHLYAISGKKE